MRQLPFERYLQIGLLLALFGISGCQSPVKKPFYTEIKSGFFLLGYFVGSLNDEDKLRDLLNANGIEADVEGSGYYDLCVPPSKAFLAWTILQTNELTLQHKVWLPRIPPEH